MKNVFVYLGMLLQLVSVFPLIPGVFALIHGEFGYAFYTTSLLYIFLGVILEKYFGKGGYEDLSFSDALKLTALSFIIIPIIGAIPYRIMTNMSVIDSIFESISGFTTTGLTVINDPSTLPKSLLLWRSMTQWIGGIGIVIVFLGIIREVSTSTLNIFSAQNIEKKLGYDILSLSRRIFHLYILLTAFGVVLFFLSSRNIFLAVNYALTSISTGGFQPVKSFPTDPPMLLSAIVMMLAGSISFLLLEDIFRGKIRKAITSPQITWMSVFLSALAAYTFFKTKNVILSTFQIVSALTTTGYQIANFPAIPEVVFFVFILAMIIGGNTNSTAGGIKTERAGLVFSCIRWSVKRASLPRRAIIPVRFGKRVVGDEELKLALIFITTYLAFGTLASFVISLDNVPFRHALFQSFSAIGTVGLSSESIAGYGLLSKLTLMVLMLFGRLEIFPLLVLMIKD